MADDEERERESFGAGLEKTVSPEERRHSPFLLCLRALKAYIHSRTMSSIFFTASLDVEGWNEPAINQEQKERVAIERPNHLKGLL